MPALPPRTSFLHVSQTLLPYLSLAALASSDASLPSGLSSSSARRLSSSLSRWRRSGSSSFLARSSRPGPSRDSSLWDRSRGRPSGVTGALSRLSLETAMMPKELCTCQRWHDKSRRRERQRRTKKRGTKLLLTPAGLQPKPASKSRAQEPPGTQTAATKHI